MSGCPKEPPSEDTPRMKNGKGVVLAGATPSKETGYKADISECADSDVMLMNEGRTKQALHHFFVTLDQPTAGMILSLKLKAWTSNFSISYQAQKQVVKRTEIPLHAHFSGDVNNQWAYVTSFFDGNVYKGIYTQFPNVPVVEFYPGAEFHVQLFLREGSIWLHIPELTFFERFTPDGRSKVDYYPDYQIIHVCGAKLIHGILTMPDGDQKITTGSDGKESDAIFDTGHELDCDLCWFKVHYWGSYNQCEGEPPEKRSRLFPPSAELSFSEVSNFPGGGVVLAPDSHEVSGPGASSTATKKSHISDSLAPEYCQIQEQTRWYDGEIQITHKAKGSAAYLSPSALEAAGLKHVDQAAKSRSLLYYLEHVSGMEQGELENHDDMTNEERSSSPIDIEALLREQGALKFGYTGIKGKESSTDLAKDLGHVEKSLTSDSTVDSPNAQEIAQYLGNPGEVIRDLAKKGIVKFTPNSSRQKGAQKTSGVSKGEPMQPDKPHCWTWARLLEHGAYESLDFQGLDCLIEQRNRICRAGLGPRPLPVRDTPPMLGEKLKSFLETVCNSRNLGCATGPARIGDDEIMDESGSSMPELEHMDSQNMGWTTDPVRSGDEEATNMDEGLGQSGIMDDSWSSMPKLERMDSQNMGWTTDPARSGDDEAMDGPDSAAMSLPVDPATRRAMQLLVRSHGSKRYEKRVKSFFCGYCKEMFWCERLKLLHESKYHEYVRKMCPGCD